jgi:hypothetical protein
MTAPSDRRGDAPRDDTVDAADALATLDALLAHDPCAGRPVRYALVGDGTAITREEVEAWVTSAEAEGFVCVRYRVDARGAGPVEVTLAAVPPAPDDGRG